MLTGLQHIGRNVGHGGRAGDSFAVPQHLREEGPQHDLGRENVVLPEERLFLAEHSLDRGGVQHASEGQTWIVYKWIGDYAKFVLATRAGCR